MKYEFDVYISFSEEDNKTTDGAIGWVDNYVRFLNTILGQLLNRTPIIVLANNREQFKKEKGYTTEELLKNTGTFVSILSENYVKDEKCTSDVDIFSKHHLEKLKFFEESEQKEGTGLFKAIKQPVEVNTQPESLKKILGFNFYKFDSESNQIIQLQDYFDSSAKKTYWLSLVDLAYHIYYVIGEKQEIKSSGRTIYLAETTPDQEEYRNNVKRELQSHGFRVLPNAPLQTNSMDLKNEILSYLKQSTLSIHIMGEYYGEKVGNSDYSLPEIQNVVAANYCDDNRKKVNFMPFERIIWIDPNMNIQDEKQKFYLNQLKKDIDNLADAEIVQTPLEIFKSIVYNKASQSIDSLKRKLSQKLNSDKKPIYLIHGLEDKNTVQPLTEWVKKNGFELIPSIFEGDQFDLVNKHRTNLATCDGVIIFYAHYNEQWLRTKLQDIIKSPGFGRKQPFYAKAIYMGLEDSVVKQIAIDQGLTIIENEGNFKSHLMEEFLNDIVQEND